MYVVEDHRALQRKQELYETIDNYEKLVKKLTGQVREFAMRVKELEAQLQQTNQKELTNEQE